jgi:hypothetical protein
MATMSDLEVCKRELASIADSGSIDPGGDARTMTEHLCTVLSGGYLDRLQAELENELVNARQGHDPTTHMTKHFRALAVLEEALKVLKARKKGL